MMKISSRPLAAMNSLLGVPGSDGVLQVLLHPCHESVFEAVLFWQYLDENPSAKEMLTGLYQAGCDPLTLITLAVLYCKGEELGVTETAKHATGYSVQQLASFSERLLG